MADITVTSAVQGPDGIVTITGTNFTQTTTSVEVDGANASFNFVSATELTVLADDDASEVTVTKGEVSLSQAITDEGDPEDAPPEEDQPVPPDPTSTPQSGEGTPAGQYDPAPAPGTVDPSEPVTVGGAQHTVEPGFGSETFTTLAGDTINKAFVPAGMEVAPQAIVPGTWPNPIDGYRAAVHGVPLTPLIPVGDEKTPYPTGASLAAGKHFWLQTGYYKSATPT